MDKLEPWFVKAVSLLHSKTEDSADQLKAMLDEAMRMANDSSSTNRIAPSLSNIIKKEGTKKLDIVCDEDIPLSKRRKESPRSSQPSSPATR